MRSFRRKLKFRNQTRRGGGSSEDDIPLSQLKQKHKKTSRSSSDDVPLSALIKKKKDSTSPGTRKSEVSERKEYREPPVISKPMVTDQDGTKCPDGTKLFGDICLLKPTDDKAVKGILSPKPETAAQKKVKMPVPIKVPKGSKTLDEFLAQLVGASAHSKKSYKSGNHSFFMYIHLIRKYANYCPIYDNHKHFTAGIINYLSDRHELQYPPSLAEQLLSCIHRGSELIVIPLTFRSRSVHDPTKKDSDSDESGAHINILIFRPFKRVVERYEPHGGEFRGKKYWGEDIDFRINEKVQSLFENNLQRVLREYTPVYKRPWEICPTKGFQHFEGKKERLENESGFCAIWSMFMMEAVLMNPTMNTSDIIQQCMNKVSDNDRPDYFKSIIRGYQYQMGQELKRSMGDFVKYDLGSMESYHALKELKKDESVTRLILETLEEAKQRSQSLPVLEKQPKYYSAHAVGRFDRDIRELDYSAFQIYIQFLKLGTVRSHPFISALKSKSDYKEELFRLFVEKRVMMDDVQRKMFKQYFEEMTPANAQKLKFFMVTNHKPTNLIDLSLVPYDKGELSTAVKKKYKEFHVFVGAYSDAKTTNREGGYGWVDGDYKKVADDVAKLSTKKVLEYLFLIKYYRMPSDDDLSNPEYDSVFKLPNPALILKDKLNQYSTHLQDLENWVKTFNAELLPPPKKKK
jgi:hypothetical protein